MNDSFQDEENKINSRVDDEFTTKDIIIKIQDWWGIVRLRRFRIISLALILGLSFALYTKFLTNPIYTASYQLFFQEESSGLTGAMRLASSLGIGGIGGGGASSSASVREFLTSRNNIAHAMNADLDNGRLIDRYYAETIDDDEEFAFDYRSKYAVNKRYTDSLLTETYIALNDDVLNVFVDKKTGVLDFSVTTSNESFAHDLAMQLVHNTEAQFKYWKRQKTQNAVKSFQSKVDSLEFALNLCLRKLGEYQDQNNSLVYALDKMEQMRLTIDLEALKVAYGEYVKALEMSKVELMNLEGPFKYFDEPIYPLKKEENSAAIAGIYGSAISSFLLILFFILRTEFRNIMRD